MFVCAQNALRSGRYKDPRFDFVFEGLLNVSVRRMLDGHPIDDAIGSDFEGRLESGLQSLH